MTRNMLTNWWGIITAILGVSLLTLGVAELVFGEGGAGGVFSAVVTAGTGGLLIGGLVLLRRHPVVGSWFIVVGAAATVLSVFLIPLAALIAIGGVWTGHLQLTTNTGESGLEPTVPELLDLTTRWYLFLLAAPVLFAIGLGALAVLGDGQTGTGEDDTGLVAGLAYLAWIVSWLGALISLGVGAVFAAKRGIARHRTRPA